MTKKRERGEKAKILLDEIDFKVLWLTQDRFLGVLEIARALKIKHSSLKPHLLKLVQSGLLDGVMFKQKIYFTCYYKITGDDNEWGFAMDGRSPFQLLADINSIYEREKFEKDFSKLLDREDEEPKLPKLRKKPKKK